MRFLEMYQRNAAGSTGVKMPPPGAEVKKVWSYSSTTPFDFIAHIRTAILYVKLQTINK
jgi:hypothetical protein